MALEMARVEDDPRYKSELLELAAICRRVPQNGADTFHEAVQSMLLAHIALFQESMGETICPGRIDQILFPFYQKDIAEGRLTRSAAKEILAAFCIKLSETVPVFPDILTRTLGGLPSYQVVTVGGVKEDGADATNDLSYLLLEIMDELRLRQPNFHIRLHENTPKEFHDTVIRLHTSHGSAPALYNDPVIIETMLKAGYSLADARNYVAIGCVEPTAQGKTLGSTDAAIINLPLALEMALNKGRRFGARRRTGAKTPPVSRMRSMEEMTTAYQTQLRHQLRKLLADLQAVEQAHARFHPTPMTSMLLDGCLSNGCCATRGGAAYNFSGIQGVGISTVGDSLYALEKAVFTDRKLALPDLVGQLKKNLFDEKLHAYLRRLDKFGNNRPAADRWTCYVAEDYADAIQALGKNTRGGPYNAGIYSNTTHDHFGSVTGALPNGRRRGHPFASGMAPENGMDRKGPTALVNSMNRIDFTRFANGINFNLKLEAATLGDEAGRNALSSIFQVYFQRGGMQAQVNVLDPDMLRAARDNPDLYPNLLVRISGYSAYFNDLSTRMKDEIISRSFVSTHIREAAE
ncbi:MAG: pyruvate formate lyase family protein, partial [Desulfosudaceae bacterium]